MDDKISLKRKHGEMASGGSLAAVQHPVNVGRGFISIPFLIRPESTSTHAIYLRPLSPTSQTQLFITNLPVTSSSQLDLSHSLSRLLNGSGRSVIEVKNVVMTDHTGTEMKGLERYGTVLSGEIKRMEADKEVKHLFEGPISTLQAHLPLSTRCAVATISVTSAASDIPRLDFILQKIVSAPPSSQQLPVWLNRARSQDWNESSSEAYDLSHPTLNLLIQHADSYMNRFDKSEISAHPLLNPLASVSIPALARANDDGDGEWTLVTRGGKHGTSLIPTGVTATSATPVKVMKKGFAEAAREGKRKKVHKSINLEEFYKFQKREMRERNIASIASKFTDDKARIDKLRQSRGETGGGARKFKPY